MQYFFDFKNSPPSGPPPNWVTPSTNTTTTFHNLGEGLLLYSKATATTGSGLRRIVFNSTDSDVKFLIKFKIVKNPNAGAALVGALSFIARSNSQSSPTNYYEIGLASGTSRELTVALWNTGYSTVATNSTAFPETQVENKSYWMRCEVVGTTLRIRAWIDGVSEPVGWGVTTTNSTLTSGFWGIIQREGQRTTLIEQLSVGTGADEPPTSPINEVISGNVLNDVSNPSARTVRVYDRQSGVMLDSTTSDATTGNYSLTINSVSEVNLVCLDDEAGTVYNDLIKRVTL
jgi:hypothetical protein